MSINMIFIICMVVLAVIGFGLGFGRSLKLATKGIAGIIISIFVCFMFGGTVRNIGAINDLIIKGNEYFTSLWGFLEVLNLGVVCYYLALFLLAQLVRVIIVKILCGIDSATSKNLKIVSKSLGAVFVPCLVLGYCLLLLAALRLIDDTAFAANILEKIDGSILMTLYQKNPIKL